MNDIVERLQLASDNVRWTREFASVAGLAGWEHQAIEEAATYIQSLRIQLKERDEAIRAALCCTPYIARNGIQYECGDPWEILRAALNGDPS